MLNSTIGFARRQVHRVFLSLGCCTAVLHPLAAQNYEWSTFAGTSGGPGLNDGPGSSAHFSGPSGLASNHQGAYYVTDAYNHSIRKVSADGIVTTFAGLSGVAGSNDGSGALARFNSPSGIATDNEGNLYVTDAVDHTLRKITPGGEVSTLAGSPGQTGSEDGPGTGARFKMPRGVAVDQDGNVILADSGNHTLRKITPEGVVSTLAGGPGDPGSMDGEASTARFRTPRGVAVAADGTLYIADSAAHAIRKLSTSGVVSTIAGKPTVSGKVDGAGDQARFNYPIALCMASDGNLWVADQFNRRMRKVMLDGVVTTVATGEAILGAPSAVTTGENGDMLVAEFTGNVITRISSDSTVSYLAGSQRVFGSSDGSGHAAGFNSPAGIAATADGLLAVADTGNHTIRRITATGLVSTAAGTPGIPGASNGTVSLALFNGPKGIALAPDGTIYVGDTGNNMVRKITPAGEVSTLAGAQGSLPPAQRFMAVDGLAPAADGSIIAADLNQIRRISPGGSITNLAGTVRRESTTGNITVVSWSTSTNLGNGDGQGTAAVIAKAGGPCLDRNGIIYLADSALHTIRKLTPNGQVTTLAGGVRASGTSDGVGNAARFSAPGGVAVDSHRVVFVADTGNHSIRCIAPDGTVTTIGGISGYAGTGEGTGSSAQFSSPSAITIDRDGNLYVADTGNHRIVRGIPLDLPEIEVEVDTQILPDQGSGSIHFGEVPVAKYMTKALIIRNTGRSVLGIENLRLSGNGFKLVLPLSLSLPAEIPVGGSMALPISFEPLVPGPHTASLEIESDDRDERIFQITLAGTSLSRPPVFAGYTASTPYETPVTLPLAGLLASASDPDGDLVEITAAHPLSVAGGVVIFDPPNVIFTPAAGFSGSDFFTITLSDSHGQTALGSVKVKVGSIPVQTNAPKLAMQANGDVSVTFQGIPGITYLVECSLDLDEWIVLFESTAGPSGVIEYVDERPTTPRAYYRVNTPPGVPGR